MSKTKGPDQGQSWVIAFASCIVNMMLSGISRGTAIFYVAMIKNYGATRLEANLPFSLRNSFRNLSGPIVGMLGQKFGVRIVSVIGGVLATLGIALCNWAPNVLWIAIFWGVIHGIGTALANTLFMVTVNQYFHKYRATAAGIALSGACLGSFIFPVTLEIFVNTYGLHGAFLLTSGVIMHVIPAALILREPPWVKSKTPPAIEKSLSEAKTQCIKKDGGTVGTELNKMVVIVTESDRNYINEVEHEENSCKYLHEKQMKNGEVKNETTNNNIPKADGLVNLAYAESCSNLNTNSKEKAPDISHRISRELSAGDISTVIPQIANESVFEKQTVLKSLYRLCCNPMFYVISLTMATFAMLFDPLMTIIVDYINDKGLDDHIAKYLISVLAIGDLVGRLCFGWVTDRQFMSVGNFMVVNQILQGLAFILFPIFDGFETLMIVVILYGVAAGTEIIMFPILVGKYLPNEQSLGIGCITFFTGIVTFTAPPLIGHFRDRAGSYDGMFYITGSLSILAGLMWFLEPLISKFCDNKSSRSVDESQSR